MVIEVQTVHPTRLMYGIAVVSAALVVDKPNRAAKRAVAFTAACTTLRLNNRLVS